jgi:hypothetical protein
MEKHRKLELQEPVPGIISHEFPQKNPFDSMASTFFKADSFLFQGLVAQLIVHELG